MYTYFNGSYCKLLYNQGMKTFPLLAILLWFCAALPVSAENDHIRIARENMPAVVTINAVKDDASTFTGTGFVLTPDGLLATSRHVVEHTVYINVTFPDGVVSGEAVPVVAAGNVDLALLKIEAQHLPTVHVADSSDVQPGQSITVIGNPRRLQNTITSGIISQVRQKADGILWHQISAPISPSSSGSPIFNANGDVVSIAFASFPGENNQNLNFSVPSIYLLELVQKAGYTLPEPVKEETAAKPLQKENPFWAHIKKSWAILTNWFHTKDPIKK